MFLDLWTWAQQALVFKGVKNSNRLANIMGGPTVKTNTK